MTYLQLVQRLAQECGAAGAPVTVVGQTGEYKRLVDWTKTAWDAIQSKFHDWDWLRASFSFTTVANQSDYTSTEAGIASRFGRWDLDYIKIYRTSEGVATEQKLDKIDYLEYRDYYTTGTVDASMPIRCCALPNQKLALGPKPESTGYTVRGDYFKSPQALAVDADTPELPEQFHEAIVWRAMMLYARYEGAPEIYQDAAINFSQRMAELTMDQRTQMTTRTFA